jgi:hypothetical protein
MLAAVPSLRAFAISLCGKVDRADDLVQETLLRAPAEMARRAPLRVADDETIGEPEVARLSALPRVPSLTFALLARQLHQIPRFVDEEKVAGIVKILSLEVCCPELQSVTFAWRQQRGRNSENSKANRIETMKGPAEFGQICSGGAYSSLFSSLFFRLPPNKFLQIPQDLS